MNKTKQEENLFTETWATKQNGLNLRRQKE